MSHYALYCYLWISYLSLAKRELVFLLSFNVLGVGCINILWHCLSLPYNYLVNPS